MFKNTASQKIEVYAFDYTTGAPKTGDAANITVYVAKDDGSTTALTDTSATEKDSTNAKGWYVFDVSQTETNADKLHFTGKSSTANVAIVGSVIYTRPPYFSTLAINSSGVVSASTSSLKRRNTAQAGSAASGTTAATLTLDASATAAHCERGDLVYIVSGTGAGNSNIVTGFNATTKVADMLQNWSAAGTPNNTSVFEVYAIGGVVPSLQSDIADAVGDNVRDGAAVPADVTYVRGTALVGTGTSGDRVRLTGLPGDVP